MRVGPTGDDITPASLPNAGLAPKTAADLEGERVWTIFGLPFTKPDFVIFGSGVLVLIAAAVLFLSGASDALAGVFLGIAASIDPMVVYGAHQRRGDIERSRKQLDELAILQRQAATVSYAVEPPRLSLFDAASYLGKSVAALISTDRAKTELIDQIKRNMKEHALCLGGSVPLVVDDMLANGPGTLSNAADMMDPVYRIGTAIEESVDYVVRQAFGAGWHIQVLTTVAALRLQHPSERANLSPNQEWECNLASELRVISATTGIAELTETTLASWRKGDVDDALALRYLEFLHAYIGALSRSSYGWDPESVRRTESVAALIKDRDSWPPSSGFREKVDAVAREFGVTANPAPPPDLDVDGDKVDEGNNERGLQFK